MSACAFDSSNSGDGLTDATVGTPDASDSLIDAQVGLDALQIVPDAPTDTPRCELWTQGHSIFDPCTDIVEVNTPLELNMPGTYTYDTDNDELRDPNGIIVPHLSATLPSIDRPYVAIVANRFVLGPEATLRVQGSLPLAIISWTEIAVAGTIDVSSSRETKGPGANSSSCSVAQVGEQDDDGGGGGGGGGYGSAGGPGGDGDNGDGAGGMGGLISQAALIGGGGCPGRAGGLGDEAIGFGPGGDGGGAIHLTARGPVTITGVIHAGGAGGFPGFDQRAAGGGGGSGGLIRLEGAAVNVTTALLTANGGGGGGGGNNNPSDPGTNGLAAVAVALGGDGENAPNGDGGDGGFRTVVSGQGGSGNDRGGGGGGGGVGYIQAITNTPLVSAPGASPPITRTSHVTL